MNVIIILYLICGTLLTFYTLGSLTLTVIFLFMRNQRTPALPLADYPTVTIQLPIYNEQYVVERLLDAVSRFDYPKARFVIQLLDDSTDETTVIAARQIDLLRQKGLNIQHIRRESRTGYKAGALTYGMGCSVTDYYAIFDADFVPPSDFLQCTLPYLIANPRLCLVQGRWGHLNPFDNALTAAQAMAIDAHFVIEQMSRSRAGLLTSFNGTGGVWRRTAIEDAGGWQATTLTEDLDLSYRAQLKGWKIRTLSDLVIPGELPPQTIAFKQQQSRWAKGSTQVMADMLPKIWRDRQLTLIQRLMATLHLGQYLPYPILLMLSLLTPLVMLSKHINVLPLGILTFSGIVPPLMYLVSQMHIYRDWHRRILAFPALIIFGTGVSLSNTVAIVAAMLGRAGGFERTPKWGGKHNNIAYGVYSNCVMYAELALSMYIWMGVWIAFKYYPAAAPYLILSALSYFVVGVLSLRESWQFSRLQRQNRVRVAGD